MRITAQSLGLFHIVPVVVLVGFTFLFAYFFILCESDRAEFQRLLSEKEAIVLKARGQLIQNLKQSNYQLPNAEAVAVYFREYEESVGCPLKSYEQSLKSEYEWSLRNSLFFVASLISTIGYGNSRPRSTAGRLLCLPCAIFGIPLFVYVVSNWGYLFYDGITAICYFIRHYCCRRATRARPPTKLNNAAVNPEATEQQRSLRGYQAWLSLMRPAERAILPHQHRIGESFSFVMILAIFVAWLLLTAIIYTFWETDWHYLQSVYFLFLSVTTIARVQSNLFWIFFITCLGDVVPESIHVRMWSFPILLVGFAILFMILAAGQANVETVYRHIWYLLQVHYQRTIPDPPDLIGFEAMNEPLLARGTPKSDISRIVKMLPITEQIIYHTLVSNSRKEFLGMRWMFLRARKNQCLQVSEPGGRKLSWSRPVQFGANEKFPRPIKSVNFDDSYLHPSDNSSTGNIYKAPSLDATSSISFTTAVSHFAALSDTERASTRTSEGDVSANAPPCCFITEGTYQNPKKSRDFIKNLPY